MNIESGAYSVACAMAVILSGFPKRLASKDVQNKARNVFGECHTVNTNVTFQNTCVNLLEFISGRAEMPGAGDVGRTVGVLTTRVNQNRIRGIQMSHQLVIFRSVVNNGSIGPDTSNGRKGTLQESRLFGTESGQDFVDLYLTNRSTLVDNFFLTPSHKFSHRSTIDAVRTSHTLQFSSILACFHRCDRILTVNQRLLRNDTVQRVVRSRGIQPDLVGIRCFTMCLQIIDNIIVRFEDHVFQMLFDFVRLQLLGIAIQSDFIFADGSVRNSYRASINISHGSHVEQVCDIVQSAEYSQRRLFGFHFLSNLFDLIGHADSSILQRMNTEGTSRDCWPRFTPDRIN
mmetsp:Transcript_2345/g.6751  ORF Transcript_2345/g.6751 Transcript_2345/m.6751 type:complete len:344 (-) Transcript_2345:21-1052(-)